MDAATAGDYRPRCRHRMLWQLPLPQSLIPLYSSVSKWICNHPAGFCMMDGGRLVFKTTDKSGSASNS
jgi:hypothetical protein